MSMASLHELFVEELQDLYDAEHQISEALPEIQQAATNRELTKAFKDHLEATKGHIKRLDQVFESIDEKAKRKTCKGMKGLLTEGKDIIKEGGEDKATLDAALIAAAQKVEHYEISAYGTLRTWANLMGHSEAVRLLTQSLDEESEADELLTQIAESKINAKAK